MNRIRFRDPGGSIRSGDLQSDTIICEPRNYSRNEVDILPPVKPSKIIGVGANYIDHVKEMGGELPDTPWLFMVGPNTLAGDGDTVSLPRGKDRVDYEAELGIVIGEQCRNVAEEEVTNVIAGYTCLNDISNRDDASIDGPHPSLVLSKGFDNATPIGPVIAPPESVPDDARIQLHLNDEVRQDASISDMHFSPAELVSQISSHMTLEPNDVIATGTPSGVGPLRPGDRIDITIEGVGKLSHSIAR